MPHGPPAQKFNPENNPSKARAGTRALAEFKDKSTKPLGSYPCARLKTQISMHSTSFGVSQNSSDKGGGGKTKADKADKGGGGKTTSGNGQAWSSASPRGQWRTGKMDKTCFEIICGAPTTLAVKGYMMR